MRVTRVTISPPTIFPALIIMLFLSSGQIYAQASVIDSLLTVLDTTKTTEQKCPVYSLTAFNYLIRGQFDLAHQYADSAIAIAESVGNDDILVKAQVVKANAFSAVGKYEQAERVLDLAEKQIPSDSILDLVDIRRQRLMIFNTDGRYDQAISLGTKLLDQLDQHAPDSPLRHYILGDMGMAAQNMLDLESALEYYQRKLTLLDSASNQRSYAITQLNIASNYRAQDSFEQALPLLKNLLRNPVITQNPRFRVIVELTLGQTYDNLDSTDQALQLLTPLADHVAQTQTPEEIITYNSAMGSLLIRTGQAQKAIPYLRQGLGAARSSNHHYGERNTCRQLGKAFKAADQLDSAFHYINASHQLTDSIYAEERIAAIKDVEAKYESAQKDREIVQQELVISKQKAGRNYLLGGLGLLGLLSLFLGTRYRLGQRDLALEKEQNLNLQQRQKLLAIDYIVQGQTAERKRIAQDLHDGLGALLATARMQLSNIQNEIKNLENLTPFAKAESLLENAHGEVRRIAHDMMPDALMNFGLKEAIQDLAHQVNSTHDVQVSTHFLIDTAELEEDVEINLYRIVQEAINNALKHAQPQSILIQLESNGSDLLLTIEDDGRGFDLSKSASNEGIGLRNIKSRAEYLNGQADIRSQPGRGTTVEVTLPVQQSDLV